MISRKSDNQENSDFLKLDYTFWKVQDFSVTQILREINFGESMAILKGPLNLVKLVNFSH